MVPESKLALYACLPADFCVFIAVAFALSHSPCLNSKEIYVSDVSMPQTVDEYLCFSLIMSQRAMELAQWAEVFAITPEDTSSLSCLT